MAGTSSPHARRPQLVLLCVPCPCVLSPVPTNVPCCWPCDRLLCVQLATCFRCRDRFRPRVTSLRVPIPDARHVFDEKPARTLHVPVFVHVPDAVSIDFPRFHLRRRRGVLISVPDGFSMFPDVSRREPANSRFRSPVVNRSSPFPS